MRIFPETVMNPRKNQQIVYRRILHTADEVKYPTTRILPLLKANQKVKVTNKVAWVAVGKNNVVGIIRKDIPSFYTEGQDGWGEMKSEKIGTNSYWITPAGKQFNSLKEAITDVNYIYSHIR